MRVGLIRTSRGEEMCLVRNISSSGLCARLYQEKRPGDVVQIELKSGGLLSGKIVWTRGLEAGIVFHAPIDLEQVLLSRWVSENGQQPRVPRVGITCPGILRVNGRSHSARVHNISPGGARLEMRSEIPTLAETVLFLPNLAPIAGHVRWSKGSTAGLSFNERLPLDLLTQWIDLQRRIQRQGASHLMVRTPSGRASVSLGKATAPSSREVRAGRMVKKS